MPRKMTKEELALQELQATAWHGVLAVVKDLERGSTMASRTTASNSEDNRTVSADVEFSLPDGSFKTLRISVSIVAPYGDGPGFCTKCRVSTVNEDYAGALAMLADAAGLCFSCATWYERSQRGMHPDPFTWVVITPEFEMYTFNPYVLRDSTERKRRTLGHGGRVFDATMYNENGTTLSSNDVWHQGTVPPVWRDEFPTNGEVRSRVRTI
jgi:hypothetical protein